MTSYIVMFGDRSVSEPILTTDWPWQALYAIDSIGKVAPEIEVRLRVMPHDTLESVSVLTVLRGKWIVPGVSKLQQEAA